MDEGELLAAQFEANRVHLTSLAYRMLGSLSEADDALQEAWLRLSRSDAAAINNLQSWLTTVVGRVCLDMLRARASRREEPMEEARLPDPIVGGQGGADPEQQAMIADSVGLALIVVLQTLNPAERLAFVLHDLFGVPFDEIAPVIGRTRGAAMKLASRARLRVRGAAPPPDTDLAKQREVVDAFLAAARGGDFDTLVAVLDPDVVLRLDGGAVRPSGIVHGLSAVAEEAISGARLVDVIRPVIVNEAAGIIAYAKGELFSVMAFAVRKRKIVSIEILTDPERLARLDLKSSLARHPNVFPLKAGGVPARPAHGAVASMPDVRFWTTRVQLRKALSCTFEITSAVAFEAHERNILS